MEKRFPESAVDTLQALSVLGIRGLSSMSEEDAAKFGNAEIGMLGEKYGQGDEPYIDPTEILQEWAMLKTLVRLQHYPTESLPVLWQIISTHHGDAFPNLVILASMAMVFPVHTADVERGFSAQNKLKTHLRNRLSSHRLNIIAVIKLEGPHWRDFSYDEALAAFQKEKDRRI